MPDRILVSGAVVDLSRRFRSTSTVGASPAAAAETVIGTLTIADDLVIASGIEVEAWAAWTVGGSGTNTNLRIRQTNLAGTIIAATGGLTTAAAALFAATVQGLDAAPVLPNPVYVLTMQVTAAVATSTVSALQIFATVV
jgi:hypothetical protein